MGVNWRNLIKIELDELNKVQYSQSARTIDASRISRIQLYTPVQLYDIGNMVKHDRRLNKLPPMTVKMIRHLRLNRRKLRGKRGGITKSHKDQPNGINKDNIRNIQVMKNHIIYRSKLFTTLLTNIQSIKGKDSLLLDELITNKIDMCIVTETWLKDQDQLWLETNDLVLNGYRIDNVNRPHTKGGGGLAIIYRSSMNVKLLKNDIVHSMEYELWECKTSGTLIHVLAVYHPPYSNTNKCTDAMFLDDFAELLEEVLVNYGNIVCMGDFNMHIDNTDNPDAQVFLDMITALGLENQVTFPTHKNGHTLDLVITESESPVSVCRMTPVSFLSDHLGIVSVLSIDKPPIESKECTYRKIKDINRPELTLELKKRLTDFETGELEDMIKLVNDTITSALDDFAPVKKKIILQRQTNPWFSNRIKAQKRLVRNHEKRWQKYRLKSNWTSFKVERNRYRMMIRSAHTQVISDKVLECGCNTKKLYSVVNGLIGRTAENPLPESQSDEQLAEDFADYFMDKIKNIQDLLSVCQKYKPNCKLTPSFSTFTPITEEEVTKLIGKRLVNHVNLTHCQ